MAMQKSKRSRARVGQGRAHFFLVPKSWTICPETGEAVAPHRVSASGYYKGKKIFKTKEELKAAKASE